MRYFFLLSLFIVVAFGHAKAINNIDTIRKLNISLDQHAAIILSATGHQIIWDSAAYQIQAIWRTDSLMDRYNISMALIHNQDFMHGVEVEELYKLLGKPDYPEMGLSYKYEKFGGNTCVEEGCWIWIILDSSSRIAHIQWECS